MNKKNCWKSAQIHFYWITRKNSSSSRRKKEKNRQKNFAIQWQDAKKGGKKEKKIKINMAQKTCECQNTNMYTNCPQND